jgi:glycyl-tRNA synthetase beta chain
MPDFLLELGLEEIPARMIDAAEDELGKRVSDLLAREALAEAPAVETYSTPRRLAVLARDVRAAQSDSEEVLKGPSVQVAYKDGQPTVAAIKFAEKAGVEIGKLGRMKDAKGEYLAARVVRKGRRAEDILSEAVPREISALYWPKNMYWRAGKPERFVRPLRWMVAMLGDSVVPLEYAGVASSRTSRGHRLLGDDVEIKEPASYGSDLKEVGVFARREERYAMVRGALDRAVKGIGRWREDPELLNTVVNLTEFPSVILGHFDREFLELPEEVLVTVMRDHQKYFAVEDTSATPADAKAASAGGPSRRPLLPHFLAVLNIDSDPQGIIRHGHERVLRARFNDARFFWTVDQKTLLTKRVEMLKAVTFQKDLGSYFDKAQRMVALAEKLVQGLEKSPPKPKPGLDGAPSGFGIDRDAVRQAALLAKTDLTTELVKEFTELQGIVGGLYARHQGLGEAVAQAIYDQYRPESMEDAVPRTLEGALVAIADKADSIAGMFALGMIPSGSKDPFALRRAANGIVKIIAELKLGGLSLQRLLGEALRDYSGSEAEKRFTAGAEYDSAVASFFRERLEFYLRDALGCAYDAVNAVLAAGADDVVDAVARAQAVAQVRASEDFEHISIAFKRIKNILRQARDTGKKIADAFDPAAVTEEAERALAETMQRTAPRVGELSGKREYAVALAEIATIRPAVDTFFDKVMVMVEDENVRANRLALLQALLNEFSTIADFSEIVTEKK